MNFLDMSFLDMTFFFVFVFFALCAAVLIIILVLAAICAAVALAFLAFTVVKIICESFQKKAVSAKITEPENVINVAKSEEEIALTNKDVKLNEEKTLPEKITKPKSEVDPNLDYSTSGVKWLFWMVVAFVIVILWIHFAF